MKSITSEELTEKVNNEENINIIDVRENEEIATGKIPGAIHIRLGDIPESLDKLDKDKHYYLVCRSGGRSGTAGEFLKEEGYDVTNVLGGMMNWEGELEF